MMRKRYKRKKGPVQSKKVTVDGINFASGLEKYMYLALKEANIFAEYEGKTFIVMEGIDFITTSYERCANKINSLHNYKCFTFIFCKNISFF
jgi:hypothetical protein